MHEDMIYKFAVEPSDFGYSCQNIDVFNGIMEKECVKISLVNAITQVQLVKTRSCKMFEGRLFFEVEGHDDYVLMTEKSDIRRSMVMQAFTLVEIKLLENVQVKTLESFSLWRQ